MGWFVALGVALVLYGLTIAPDLVWHDAGDYQWQAARMNLSRPGDTVRVHPFFVILSHVLGKVGLWNYAEAANVTSVIGTALLAANIWLIAYLIIRRLGAATIGFLSCLLAHTIWQQGVQAQTYGWSNAFMSAMIVVAICYIYTHRVRWLLLMFFLGGVGLSAHVMSQLVLVVLGIWVLFQVFRRRTPAWILPAGIVLWVVGGALFWYVVYLEFQRTGSVNQALVSAFVGKWSRSVFNVSGVPKMLLRSFMMLVLNFPTPIALLGIWGIWRSRRLLRGTPLAGLLGAMLALYTLFACRYQVPNQNFFFTPAYALVAVYIALGVHATGWCERKWALLVLVALTVSVAPTYWAMTHVARAWKVDLRGRGKHERVIPYRDFYTYYLLPWQHVQTGPRRFAEEAIGSLPPDAVLIADSTTVPPLGYVRYIEGQRPDVLVMGTGFDQQSPSVRNYWSSTHNLLPGLRAEGRRVFVVSGNPSYMPKWVSRYARVEPFGIIFEVKPRKPKGSQAGQSRR